MMNEKIRKNFGIKLIFLMIMFFVFLPIGESKAALQANPNTHYKKIDSFSNFINNIRKMEESNGTMGLKETFNEDLTSSSGSNGIDVHMERSTEYGAVAILSASGYGNANTLQNSEIKTTTGNKSGVYFSGQNYEYVAGGMESALTDKIINANKKYYDIYTASISSAKMGDALGNSSTTNPGCAGWHSSKISSWVWDYYSTLYNYGPIYFCRGGNGGIFSYNYSYYFSNGSHGSNSNYSRGVAVVGEGF